MKCRYCDADIPEGQLFCPSCGKEVQLVPDYQTMESIIKEQEMEQEKTSSYVAEDDNPPGKKTIKKKKVHVWLISIFVVAGCAIAGVLIWLAIQQRNLNSFSYQYKRAQTLSGSGDYAGAETYIRRAAVLEPKSVDAKLLMASILTQLSETEEAIQVLNAVISYDGSNMDAYQQLISLHEKAGNVDAIKSLMDHCSDTDIRSQFAAYITGPPQISPISGNYKYKAEVTIVADGGCAIYYTTDGSDPDGSSQLYEQTFLLSEGDNIIKAIAVNEKGIKSNVVTNTYTVALSNPDPPMISPMSGTFLKATKITVTVPDGCTAYYAFDDTPTTDSKKYTSPVSMRKGEHIFSVILVDKNGKQSYPASETYVYTPS